MRIGHKLITNTVYLTLDWFVVATMSFVFWFSLGKTLVKEELGQVSTLINFVVLLSWICILGITWAIQKLIPEFKKRDSKKVNSLIRISIKPVLIVLAVTLLSIFIFSNQISQVLKVPREGVLISIFALFAIVIFSFFGSIIFGFQNMKKYFLTDFLQSFFKLSVSLILIYIGFRVYGPLIGFGMGYFISMFMRIDLKYFRGKSSGFSYKELFSYSSPAFVSTVASYAMTNSQYIIISIMKNPAVTGIFTIAFIITSFIGIMINVLAYSLFPIISGMSVNRKMKSREGYLIGLVLRYSLTIIIPIAAVLLVFSNLFVLSFSNIGYISASAYFPILIPAAILFGLGGLFNTSIYAIGKPNLSRNITVATAVLFLSLSIVGVNYFSILGISIAYLTSMLFYFVLNLIYIRNFLTIKIFTKDVPKILFSAVSAGLLLLLFYPMVRNIISLGAISISYMIIYLIILLPLKFYKPEDIRALEFLSGKIPQLSKSLLKIINFVKKFSK